MRFISKYKYFLAFTALFAVSASIVFWGSWASCVGFIAPDDSIFFPYDYEDTLLNWRNMFFTTGKAHPLDLLWSGLIISPVSCSQFKYIVPAFLSAVALSWFLRGKGLSRLASYSAGLFLAFSGYWITLFSAGHGNWFIWMSYGVFAFGLIDRAVASKGFRYWLLLGLSVAWASFYAPDVWLLFSCFTFLYLVYKLILFKRFPFKGMICAFFVFLIIAAPSVYFSFSRDIAVRDKQIQESSVSQQGVNVDSKEQRWVFVTNWSMHLEDTFEFFIPRYQGDTSCPLTLSINKEKGTVPYTGAIGRTINATEGNYRQHSLYVGFVTCVFALIAVVFLFKGDKGNRRESNFLRCDVVFFLIFIFVVLQSVFEVIVDLCYAHLFNLFGGECQSCYGVERNLALFAEVPKRGVQMVAVMHNGNNRNLCALYERTHRVGHIGCNAAGGVARFGIHAKHVAFFEHVINGFDKRQIGDVLTCSNGTDEFHQPRTTVITVNANNVIYAVG